jgi:hypothetical protein
MRATCKSNALQLAARMGARARAVGPELRKAADEIAGTLQKESVAILDRDVYGVPIPTTSSGRPMWVRTGRLRGAERFKRRGVDVYHENRTPYSRHRRNLGLPGYRMPVYTKSVQWYEDAIRRRASWIRRTREAAIRRALVRAGR